MKTSLANIDAIRFGEIASPTAPSSGFGLLYFKVDGKPYAKNSGGSEYDLAQSAAGATSDQLREWTEGEDFEATAITVDSDEVVTTATVKWPDGSAGTFTTTTKNSTWLAIDAYTISHVDSSQTVTQAAVTRNAQGTITAKPVLTVA